MAPHVSKSGEGSVDQTAELSTSLTVAAVEQSAGRPLRYVLSFPLPAQSHDRHLVLFIIFFVYDRGSGAIIVMRIMTYTLLASVQTVAPCTLLTWKINKNKVILELA